MFIDLYENSKSFNYQGRSIYERKGDLNIFRPTRIGIGITTYNRPECLAECIENIKKHSKPLYGVECYVATDTDEDRRGVAYRKNECLRALKDCDYVFLFDDDCFPIKDGWINFFINSGYEHLLYLNKTHNIAIESNTALFYNDCGGVFMFMKKSAIDRVGAFNESFSPYSFEHCEYSIRILGKRHSYPCLKNTSNYIFAHDYSTPNHKSSITDEEKKECIKNNWDNFFKCEIKDIYLPL